MYKYPKCHFAGTTPQNNIICCNCPEYLIVCQPIASEDGYAFGSECDSWFCEGCTLTDCPFKSIENRSYKNKQ